PTTTQCCSASTRDKIWQTVQCCSPRTPENLQDLLRPAMFPLAWVLALRRARQHVCCGREQQGCAVHAWWGCRGGWGSLLRRDSRTGTGARLRGPLGEM